MLYSANGLRLHVLGSHDERVKFLDGVNPVITRAPLFPVYSSTSASFCCFGIPELTIPRYKIIVFSALDRKRDFGPLRLVYRARVGSGVYSSSIIGLSRWRIFGCWIRDPHAAIHYATPPSCATTIT